MTVVVVFQLAVTMGKKSKKAKSVTAEAESGMPRHVRREVLEIANQLLESKHSDLPCYCLQYWLPYSYWNKAVEVECIKTKMLLRLLSLHVSLVS